LRSGKFSYAIFADIGSLGEGSIALADNLGIRSDARDGGTRGGVLYLVFPGSGNHQPKSVEEINEQAGELFQNWGGIDQARSCAGNWMNIRPTWFGWDRRSISFRPRSNPTLLDSERNADTN
jgi:hypothetical protein